MCLAARAEEQGLVGVQALGGGAQAWVMFSTWVTEVVGTDSWEPLTPFHSQEIVQESSAPRHYL